MISRASLSKEDMGTENVTYYNVLKTEAVIVIEIPLTELLLCPRGCGACFSCLLFSQ